MTSTRLLHGLVSLLGALLAPLPNLLAAESPQFTIGVEVDHVLVPITVRNRQGGLVKGLPPEAFRILEDGVEQDIVLFEPDTRQLRTALVLDTSCSVKDDWPATTRAARAFAHALRNEDEFSVVTFNERVRLQVDWGRNAAALEPLLEVACCGGLTGLWDTIWSVSQELVGGERLRETVLVMTDGLDNASRVSYRAALDAAVRSEATFYVISKTEAVRMAGVREAPTAFELADRRLRELADLTGGRVFYSHVDDLEHIYEQILVELRNRYLIGYVSNYGSRNSRYRWGQPQQSLSVLADRESRSSWDPVYRSIQVKVREPGVVVQARSGYFPRRDFWPADRAATQGRQGIERGPVIERRSVSLSSQIHRGTELRLRLKKDLSPGGHPGERVELITLDEVRVGGSVLIPQGASAWGTLESFGRSLRFQIQGVQAVTGETVPLHGLFAVRYDLPFRRGDLPPPMAALIASATAGISSDRVLMAWFDSDFDDAGPGGNR